MVFSRSVIMKAKSRFGKHKHVITMTITVFGALLVFGTYVVKDVIREEVRDTVDSLQAADYQFVVTSEIHANFRSLATLVLNRGEKANKDYDTLDPAAIEILENVTSDVEAAGSLEVLIEKLPANEASLRKSNDDLQKRRNSLLELTKKLAPEMQKLSSSPIDKIPGDMVLQIGHLRGESEALGSDLTTAQHQTVKRSREIRNAAEQRLKRFTRVGYVLYRVGWSLALRSARWCRGSRSGIAVLEGFFCDPPRRSAPGRPPLPSGWPSQQRVTSLVPSFAYFGPDPPRGEIWGRKYGDRRDVPRCTKAQQNLRIDPRRLVSKLLHVLNV
jgi:hypothetical protein